jgi:ABC-2 type transport system ATP-binding protein
VIEVKNLVKQYGTHTAVDNLNFTVEKGQIYGFLGPNGAGKTTTMNIITGYIAPTEGEVIINGHDIYDEPEEAKKNIGYLPEIPPLYMDMKVHEYLMFCAELKEMKKEDRTVNVEEVMELTRISDVGGRLIKNISKGYKQRVGLAQALLGYPEILILDEPTVGLDPKQIIEIRELIKSFAKKHTIILSSHILQEVSAVCDHIIIIDHGKLIVSDTPENLSKLTSGSNLLELQIKGNEEKVKEILSGNEKIAEFEILEKQDEGTVEVKIKTKSDEDIREELSYTFAENKCPILSMHTSSISLEDVFLQLTQDDENNQDGIGNEDNIVDENEEEK